MFHENTVLQPDTRSLLNELGPRLCDKGFFLVGGTALAIHLGHRLSIDLDFFTRDPFDVEHIIASLSGFEASGVLTVIGRAENTIHLNVNDIKVDVIRYRYPLLEAVVDRGNYRMLAVPDIAAMKLAAITNRGSKKDFFDLHFLLKDYSLQELLAFYQRKFSGHDIFSVVRSLAWFDDAEAEPDPVMLEEVDWSSVKESVRTATKSV